MVNEISIGKKKLDFEECNRRFPGLSLNVPCGAIRADGEDGDSVPTPICHVLDNLSLWNYVLWHVGLQLRELRAPGRLRLVRVFYRGIGGRTLLARSHAARILFRVLLAQHSCVESLCLDDALLEGSGLCEYRQCVVSAVRQNASLRTLILGSIFLDYRGIRGELFDAIATMTNLREFTVVVNAAASSFELDALCKLLVDTTCLTTLTIPRLVFDAESGCLLIAALRRNDTIQNLCLNGSIVHSYTKTGDSRFSDFLANSTQLSSLSVEGVDMGAASTFQDIECIVRPLCTRANIQRLRLTGFRLSTRCASLFAAFVSGKEGALKSLDIAGCRWKPKPRLEWTYDVREDGEQLDQPSLAHQNCDWIQALDPTTPIQLSFLALGMGGLELEDLQGLLNTAHTVKSLKTISLSGIPLEKLKAVCIVIRQTEMSDRVRIEDAYLVSAWEIVHLRECPEALSKVAIRSFMERTPKEFVVLVRLACYWYRVTLLNLYLAQGILSDVTAFRTLCYCLSTADSLRVLSLTGCDEPDLSHTLRSAGRPYSVLLEMIFKNAAIRGLRLNGFHMGEANLRFFVAGVVASRSLCELAFASCSQAENDTFIKLLASKISQNETITHLRFLTSSGCLGDEWFVLENIVGRNIGLLTCAAHYVVDQDYSPRCHAALALVSGTNALKQRVEELMRDGEITGNSRSNSAA